LIRIKAGGGRFPPNGRRPGTRHGPMTILTPDAPHRFSGIPCRFEMS
jgi:hypothetical protein